MLRIVTKRPPRRRFRRFVAQLKEIGDARKKNGETAGNQSRKYLSLRQEDIMTS